MATKEIVTSVVFTLTDGATTVTVTDNASKAYGDFTHGLPITDDSGATYPYHAILFALPTFESVEVDMTDNSCVGSSSGDVVFRFEVSTGSFVDVTTDMLDCQNTGEAYAGGFVIPNAQLQSNVHYIATVGGQHYELSVQATPQGNYMGNELIAVMDAETEIRVMAIPPGGTPFSSCEEMERYTIDLFTGATFVLNGDR